MATGWALPEQRSVPQVAPIKATWHFLIENVARARRNHGQSRLESHSNWCFRRSGLTNPLPEMPSCPGCSTATIKISPARKQHQLALGSGVQLIGNHQHSYSSGSGFLHKIAARGFADAEPARKLAPFQLLREKASINLRIPGCEQVLGSAAIASTNSLGFPSKAAPLIRSAVRHTSRIHAIN